MAFQHCLRRVALSAAALLAVCTALVALSGAAHAAPLTTPSPPFTQCPAIGSSPSCAILIVFNADGTTSILTDGSVGPFDVPPVEDTLVGVQNDTGVFITNVRLTSSQPIFALDGDGICAATTLPQPAGCPFGPPGVAQTYQGPDTSFAITDNFNGKVNFTGNGGSGLAAGASTYFGLEEHITGADITIPKATLTYTGDTSQDFNDVANLSANLVDATTNAPITGATVNFTLGSQSCSGTTDGGGNASCSITINQTPGSYTVNAMFPSNGTYQGASASAPFTVNQEQAALSSTPLLQFFAQGGSATLSAVLTDPDGGAPISGEPVTLTLGSGAGQQSCTGTTDGSGTATCTISPVTVGLGPQPITDSFAGDAFYQSATHAQSALIFAFLDKGAFVVGDKSAAAGGTQTFWGAQWSKLNSLSGGSAPAAFEGFAEKPTPPVCGQKWSTDTGDSTPPPAGPLPSYMGVIVSSSISQSGSTISGDTAHIVVVKTDPGYAGNPGHAGTGTIVGQFC